MKLSHSLRVIIFLLRLALGIDLFYLGFGTLFSPTLGMAIRAQSFGNIYSWLAAPAAQGGWIQPVAQWAFLIIGICLIVGLLTRIASVAGIVLVLLSYLPTVSFSAFSAAQFINDEVIVVICLLILIFANAGKYLGLDSFIHIGSSKHSGK
ncbi:MAG TPA: DoxX family protein [Candidatus Paceibacterota bacterium]|nr:DoxX family protein [Candidatus Paceibacterota bacterium]